MLTGGRSGGQSKTKQLGVVISLDVARDASGCWRIMSNLPVAVATELEVTMLGVVISLDVARDASGCWRIISNLPVAVATELEVSKMSGVISLEVARDASGCSRMMSKVGISILSSLLSSKKKILLATPIFLRLPCQQFEQCYLQFLPLLEIML